MQVAGEHVRCEPHERGENTHPYGGAPAYVPGCHGYGPEVEREELHLEPRDEIDGPDKEHAGYRGDYPQVFWDGTFHDASLESLTGSTTGNGGTGKYISGSRVRPAIKDRCSRHDPCLVLRAEKNLGGKVYEE